MSVPAAAMRGIQSSMNITRRCSSTSPHSWEGRRTRAAGGSPEEAGQGLGLVGIYNIVTDKRGLPEDKG